MKDLKNQMEVKAREKIEKSDEVKYDVSAKDTDRKQVNEKLQQVRDRKLQQLR